VYGTLQVQWLRLCLSFWWRIDHGCLCDTSSTAFCFTARACAASSSTSSSSSAFPSLLTTRPSHDHILLLRNTLIPPPIIILIDPRDLPFLVDRHHKTYVTHKLIPARLDGNLPIRSHNVVDALAAPDLLYYCARTSREYRLFAADSVFVSHMLQSIFWQAGKPGIGCCMNGIGHARPTKHALLHKRKPRGGARLRTGARGEVRLGN